MPLPFVVTNRHIFLQHSIRNLYLLLPLRFTEILTLHYKKNEQQSEPHCSIQDLLGIIATFEEKKRSGYLVLTNTLHSDFFFSQFPNSHTKFFIRDLDYCKFTVSSTTVPLTQQRIQHQMLQQKTIAAIYIQLCSFLLAHQIS